MTDSAGGSAPGAGWFADPAGSEYLRWWDGRVWTENFIDPVTGVAPAVAFVTPEPQSAVVPTPRTSGQPLTRRELRERDDATAHTEPVAIAAPFAPTPPGSEPENPWLAVPPPTLADAYAFETDAELRPAILESAVIDPGAFEAPSHRQLRESVERGSDALSANTVAVWIFAALPLVHIAIICAVYGRTTPPSQLWLRWLVLLGPILIYLLLARIDRQTLLRNGHDRVPPTAFAIVPPLYLGIRLARVGVAAVAPLIAWFILQIVTVGLLVALLPSVVTALTATDSNDAVDSVQPTVTASVAPHVLSAEERAAQLTQSGMAATLRSDFLAQGIHFTKVVCPPIPAQGDGVQLTCVGTLESTTLNIIVALDSANPTAAFDIVSSLPAS